MHEQVSYALSFAEFKEASDLLCARVYRFQWLFRRFWLPAAILLAIPAVILWSRSYGVDVILFPLACGVAGGGLVGAITRPIQLRKVFRRSSRVSAESNLTLSDDGISGKHSTGSTGFVPWGQVQMVLKGKRVWVLRCDYLAAMTIPTRVLSEETRAAIESRVGRPVTPPAAP